MDSLTFQFIEDPFGNRGDNCFLWKTQNGQDYGSLCNNHGKNTEFSTASMMSTDDSYANSNNTYSNDDNSSTARDTVLPNADSISMALSDVATPPLVDLRLNPSEANAILRKEMNLIPRGIREYALYDIHGVADKLKEDQSLLLKSLKQMDVELSMISQKPAYDMAFSTTPDYVTNRDFRLAFLRADEFDASNAAARLVKFLEVKLTLFGPEKLTRDVVIDDLQEEERRSLESGYLQVFPGRDRAGRAILCCCAKLMKETSIESRLRLYFYMIMSMMEDEETQQTGIAIIYYAVYARTRKYSRSCAWKVAAISRVLPVRFVGIHLCFKDRKLLPFLEFGRRVLSPYQQVRLRFHCGSDLECQYNLMTFGIPKHLFPFDSEGNYSVQNHMDWLCIRRTLEFQRRTMIDRIPTRSGSTTLDVIAKAPSDRLVTVRPRRTNTVDPISNISINPFAETSIIHTDNNTTSFISGTATCDGEERHAITDVPMGTSNYTNIDLVNQVMENPMLKTKNQMNKIKLQQRTPQIGQSIMVLPRPSDVLFGRGKVIQAHKGNLHYRHLISTHMEKYEKASKFEKTAVAGIVLSLVKKSNGRFLKQGPSGWIEVDDSTARDKISHAFRNRRNAPGSNSSASNTEKEKARKMDDDVTKASLVKKEKISDGNSKKFGSKGENRSKSNTVCDGKESSFNARQKTCKTVGMKSY